MLTNLSNTSGQPNSVVVIQQGLQVQPVVLVDQYGSAVTISGGGSSGTATALATLTTPVVVSGATAPTTGQVLTAVSASVATWQNSTSGFSNPMTTAGDLIDATTGGAAQRLGIGTVGQVLTVSSGTAPAWGVASITGGGTGGTTATLAFANLSPMTTPGDVIYENSSTVPTRLAGNTTATKKFLTGTGTGSAAQAPAWGTIATSDLPVDGSGVGGPTTAGLGLLIQSTSLPLLTTDAGGIANQRGVFMLATATVSGTVSKLGIQVVVAGVTAGSGVNGLAIYSEPGTLLSNTGDMTSAFENAASIAEGTLGTSQTITAGTNYYLGVAVSFTGTLPTFVCAGEATNLLEVNGHYLTGFNGSYSSWANITPSALTGNNRWFWIYGR